MTVGELVALLGQCDPESTVIVEDCDMEWWPPSGVEVRTRDFDGRREVVIYGV